MVPGTSVYNYARQVKDLTHWMNKCVKYYGLQLYHITSLINPCECHELVLEGSTFHTYLPTYYSGKLIQHTVTGHLDHDTMQTKVDTKLLHHTQHCQKII